MASDAEILDILDGILSASRQMLAAAKEGNWEAFIEQELGRQNTVKSLQEHLGPGKAELPTSIQAQANHLIQEIGRLDGETMALTESRMADIAELSHSNEVSKQLNKTYLKL